MEEILDKISSEILKYNNLKDVLTFDDSQKLSSILKNLSSSLFFLESYRDYYARTFNTIQHNLIKEGLAISRAEIEAKEQVPELYMLRRIMTSAYKVTDSIRTNISYLKNEK